MSNDKLTMKILEAIIKKVNRNLVGSVCLIIFFLCSCANDNVQQFKSEGSIIGQDFRKCVCCGGWEIVIDGTTYHFDKLPSNSGINLDTEKFPINVKLDWTIDTTSCKWIVISKIIKE